jgi:hypothetical protein
MPSKIRSKKKNFSSFNKTQAFKQLHLTNLIPWKLEFQPIQPSDFFQQRLARLNRCFDLESYEESKKLLIDAICEESLDQFDRLKIWKGAMLETDITNGSVDYLIAERKRYLDKPLLCIIEAKRDNFEQGLAQCLVEMQACQWQNQQNQQLGKAIDIYGIVTNGEGWKFYKLQTTGEVYETLLYSIGDIENVLGLLHSVFQNCEQNLE